MSTSLRVLFHENLFQNYVVGIDYGGGCSRHQSGFSRPVHCNPSSLAYTAPQNYYTSEVVVPVSATCSFHGGQLSIVGEATDASTNAHLGSAGAVLSAAYGINIYTGQLVFNLPPQVTGHTLQISISIFGGIYNGFSNGSPLTTSVETVQVNPSSNYFNYANCYYNTNCGFNSPSNNNQLQCPSLSMYNTVQCVGNSNNYYSNYPYNNNPTCYYNNNCNQMYNSCQLPIYNNQVQCVGILYKNSSACVILRIPLYSAVGLVSYQYYTLQKLPSSYPAIGTWVFVAGQFNQGNNSSPTGAPCPGNYINVALITPT